jgi:hypothetical protein
MLQTVRVSAEPVVGSMKRGRFEGLVVVMGKESAIAGPPK